MADGRVTLAGVARSCRAAVRWRTVLSQLPASRPLDGDLDLPDVTRRRFHLAGSSWDVPSYDNAEAFVAALVRNGVVTRDPLVTDLHRRDVAHGTAKDVSTRTEQRRFLAATGMTRSAARQVDRARHAAVLLREGVAIADVIEELGAR